MKPGIGVWIQLLGVLTAIALGVATCILMIVIASRPQVTVPLTPTPTLPTGAAPRTPTRASTETSTDSGPVATPTGAPGSCGDGVCSGGETCLTCRGDCGPCATPSPTSTRTPGPTPTNTQTPRLIESGNPNIEIKLVNAGGGANGHVRVQVLLPPNSGFDPEKYSFELWKVVKDIGGGWNDVWSDHGEEYTLGYDGTFQAWNIAPGDYTLFRQVRSRDMGASMIGASNVSLERDSGGEFHRILFPVEAGKETHIAIHLSAVSVGVLREDGSAVLGYTVHPICQSPWVCGHEEISDPETGPDGLATLYIAPGTYDVMFEGYFGRCYRFNSISVGKNEVTTMVFDAGEADAIGSYHGDCD